MTSASREPYLPQRGVAQRGESGARDVGSAKTYPPAPHVCSTCLKFCHSYFICCFFLAGAPVMHAAGNVLVCRGFDLRKDLATASSGIFGTSGRLWISRRRNLGTCRICAPGAAFNWYCARLLGSVRFGSGIRDGMFLANDHHPGSPSVE
jgi:hypothetical protein